MTIWRRVACWMNKAACAQVHVRARAPSPTHTHTQERTHPRAQTHTQKYVTLVTSPRQKWISERI